MQKNKFDGSGSEFLYVGFWGFSIYYYVIIKIGFWLKINCNFRQNFLKNLHKINFFNKKLQKIHKSPSCEVKVEKSIFSP